MCAFGDGDELWLETAADGRALLSVERDDETLACLTLSDHDALALADGLIEIARHYSGRDLLTDVI